MCWDLKLSKQIAINNFSSILIDREKDTTGQSLYF